MGETNFISQMPKLYELKTRLLQDKENYETLYKQYSALIEIVEGADRSAELPCDFLEGIKSYQSQITESIQKMAERLVLIDALIAQYEAENDPTAKTPVDKLGVDTVVTLVFDALGIDPGAAPTANTEEAVE